MKHRINPIVDCVFKAMLGKEDNKESLIHFLNAVLKPDEDAKIKEATLLNPYNKQEFQDDKLTIVDVKVRDEKGRQYQIEIQMDLSPTLKHRVLYTWSHLYHSMLNAGDDYAKLKKAVSIWLVAKPLFPECKEYHLPFSIYNIKNKILLSDHLQIHIIQLPHWQWQETIHEELDRWMYLLTQGENVDLDQPPEILKIREMKPAMETIKRFSENEEDYDLYFNRRLAQMDFEVIKRDIQERTREEMKIEIDKVQKEKEQAIKEKGQALKEKEQALKEKGQALKEKEKLLNLLRQSGIEPNQ